MSDLHDRLEALEGLAAHPGYRELESEMRSRAGALVMQALHESTDIAQRPVLAGQWRELNDTWIGWAARRATQVRKQIERAGGEDG